MNFLRLSKRSLLPLCALSASLLGFSCLSAHAAEKLKTENVFLITTDGLRWNELFAGADESLLNLEAGGIKDVAGVRAAYWRDTPEQRREVLMPFVWGVLAKQGQLYGNQTKGSVSRITNGRNFSYPSYNEILTGFPNPEIVSNDKIPNKNVTVLEWLHNKPAFKGKVAAFSAWDVSPFILNRERCGFPVMGGWEPVPDRDPNPRQELLNTLIKETVRAGSTVEVYDSFVFHAAREHLLRHQPRVLMINFLETDYWGHVGQYHRYLEAAHRVDDYLRQLWEYIEATPQYRGKTSIILATDHGRGAPPTGWKTHGAAYPTSEFTWVAVFGPDTQPLGERAQVAAVTHSQIAATLAALLGENFAKAEPRAGAPMREVLPSQP